MHVVSRRAPREFWNVHRSAREPLAAWFRLMETGEFPDFSSIKLTFRAADYLAPFTIFDIGGNKYRLVAVIHYNRQRIYIRHIFTHLEYDRWSRLMRRRRRS